MAGTVTGVALKPGVSLNNRLYTKSNIGKAYERLKARISDPNGSPVVMRTHHGAGDDSTRIVGQVKAVSLDEDGTLRYTADFVDTEHAQTIRKLAKPGPNGKPTLAHVSIYGGWTTEPTTETMDDGTKVTTAPDLEIDAIDFTATPGVVAASAAAESGPQWAITESASETELTITEGAPAQLVVDEADSAKPYGDVIYADPGYQKDKKKRYPLDTKPRAKAALSYINQKANADLYTAAQLKRIKARIKSALKKFGVDVSAESLESITKDPGFVSLAETRVGECIGCYDDGTGTAGFSISAYNGPLTVTVSAYNGVEPADLSGVAMAAMAAACDAIHALDPDDDGDIDTGVTDTKVDPTGGDQMEAASKDPAATAAEAVPAATSAAIPSQEKEAVVSDATESKTATAEVAAPEIDYAKLAEAVVAATAKATEEKAAADKAAAAAAETATANEAQLREAANSALVEAARGLLLEGKFAPVRRGNGLAEQTEAGPSTASLFERRGELFAAGLRSGGFGRAMHPVA